MNGLMSGKILPDGFEFCYNFVRCLKEFLFSREIGGELCNVFSNYSTDLVVVWLGKNGTFLVGHKRSKALRGRGVKGSNITHRVCDVELVEVETGEVEAGEVEESALETEGAGRAPIAVTTGGIDIGGDTILVGVACRDGRILIGN